MAVAYPTGLRGPLANKSKTQFPFIRTTQPLSGPAYEEELSTDAPVTYDLTFRFTSPSEALLFRVWVENNKINRGVPFDCPIRTEASNSGGNTTQECVFVPTGDSDLLSNTSGRRGTFTYQGTFRCRKEITGLEDFYDLIEEGGLYLLEGRAVLDESINQDAPEA